NDLTNAPRSIVREFVEKHNGHIITNGITFTVMATPEVLKINAEYIRMADQYIEAPGASEGGGGKGISKVENPDNFKQAFAQVQGEVPGSPIFHHATCSRCSSSRSSSFSGSIRNAISFLEEIVLFKSRHQKIIEEAPVKIAKQETFESTEKAAVRLARLVEHPTTEMVS
ncbi:3375_t:CDS:2, partial [Funneliformis geosporum]